MKKKVLPLVYPLLLLMFLIASCSKEKNLNKPPNIVWITSEDNSKHYMKLFEDNGVETPNIESLAENGMIFKNCFSNAPVCSVARSTLISGCYAPRVGAQYHRKLQKVPMPDGLRMFPALLGEAGYHTTNNSKEDYNFFKPEDVWSESSKTASWSNRKEGQPFFHVFNIGTTHESSLHFDKEEMARPNETALNSFSVQPNHPDTELFKYTNARYRDNIRKMDQKVGAVIDQLKKEGLYDSTFIFYFGDHGGVLPGSKGYLYETGLHVPLVIHIPEKFSHLVDSTKRGAIEGFVSFVDFAPTVLHLAGIPLPKEMDGTPFLGPNIASEELAQRDETYGYADRFDEKYDMVRSLRKGKFKYIRSYQPFNFDGLMNNYRYKQIAYRQWASLYDDGALNEIQSQFFEPRKPEMLFDIETDPFETKNLANDPKYGTILGEMRGKLNKWVENIPDLSFFPEHFLLKNAFENPVAFGKEHTGKIQDYSAIANLGLRDFHEVEEDILASLRALDPWKRYWGIIVCSTFGERAKSLAPIVKELAHNEQEELINSVRAAEFLGLIEAQDPSKVMTEALYRTQNGAEALLILNSIVLMRDGHASYDFDIDAEKISQSVKDNPEAKRRLVYLDLL